VEGTPARRRRRGAIAAILDKIDDHVTARADRRAREMGLQISRIPGTRTQVYRDSRWDLRQECADCAGSGLDGAASCPVCEGTGVITLAPAPQAREPR